MDIGGKEVAMASHNILKGKMSDHIAVASAALKDGYVIVLPVENSYALAADAFVHDSVRALHVLRGDPLGTIAQVAITSADAIDGIARNISPEARTLMSNFWPGQLSMTLRPQPGLSWDLGDAGQLNAINVCVPSPKFISKLIKNFGPIAIASANSYGLPALNDHKLIKFSESEVAAVFTAGELPNGPASTVIDATGEKMEILREGAISIDQITSLVSDISHR